MKVVDVDFTRRRNVYPVCVDHALLWSKHGEPVKYGLGLLVDAEDRNLVNHLGGSLDVHVVIVQDLHHTHSVTIVNVVDTGTLVVP